MDTIDITGGSNMEKEISAVFIMDEDQYKHYEYLADSITGKAYIDELGRYPLGFRNSGYYVVEINISSGLKTQEETLRFLTTAFKFICLRIAGTQQVFVSSLGDLNDLYEDFYNKRSKGQSLQKDLLTTAERYNMIIQSLGQWSMFVNLCMIYTDDGETDVALIDLNETTPELFGPEDIISLMNETTGEVHKVNLIENIDKGFLVFNVDADT